MSSFYISVDGGGTKTEFCALNTETKEYISKIYTGSNYKYFEDDQDQSTGDVAEMFLDFIKENDIAIQDIAGAVFGISGIDSEKDLIYYQDLLKKTGMPSEKMIICNDCEFALRGNVDGDGIAVVTGTGGIVYGITDGHPYRVAGWGPPYSDLGSGTWIGAEGIKEAILRLDEGATEDDPVVKCMLGFKQEDAPLQWSLSLLDIPATASVAKGIVELAQSGESACQEIVTEAAYHIAGYICTVLRLMKYDKPEIKVVYVGSIHKNEYWRSLLEPITQQMAGKIKIQWIMPTECAAKAGLNYVMREL